MMRTMQASWLWAWIGLLIAGTDSPAADVSINVTTNYYVVRGTNLAQVRAAMVQARPWGATLGCDAFTQWDINCVFSCRRAGRQWVLDQCTIKTKVTITLPRLEMSPPLDRNLAGEFWSYLKALNEHEQGHVQLARDAAETVRRRFSLMGNYPSAQELTTEGQEMVNSTISSARQREREYDRETHHGATQGAVFGRTAGVPVRLKPPNPGGAK
jgi:predicted secreted Zn-dependent protease